MQDQETPDIQEQQPEHGPVVTEEVTDAPETVEAAPKGDSVAENFRRIRARNEELERQNKEVLERIKQLESAQTAQKKQRDPDDIPLWRDIQEELAEVKIRTKYPDFDRVFNAKNLAALKEQDPDLALLIYNTPDLYKKSEMAYRYIKKFGIHDEQVDQDSIKIKENRAKPRTLTSMSPQEGPDGPLSHANAFAQGLTPDLKQKLWEQTNSARKKH